ncbi:MAG: OmpA family protein [Hyphomicrobiaceae bacterium]|nr:OmpA family protein [Hyphomicrobiaceae bacterium]
MARKKKKAPEGAPEWMVTYGDMMTLLLCFFVILFSLSEPKQDDKIQQFLENIRETFGAPNSSTGQVTDTAPPLNTITRILREWQRPIEKLKRGNSPMEGQQGKHTEVRQISEGLEFRVGKGGRTPFTRGSAEIVPEFKPELRKLAKLLRGYNNVLSIRGHCSMNDFPPDPPRRKMDALSFARAQAIKEYLVGRCDLEPRRIRAVACGTMQPLKAAAYEEAEHAENRRVEIIMRQVLMNDYVAAQSPNEAGE